jgi:tRNA(fMet)-specific endonuclease VapC
MSRLYLLDTNVVSESMRLRPSAALLAWVKEHRAELAIGAPTWHELWYGWHRLPVSTRRDFIENYLTKVIAVGMPILAYDDKAADWHARERARLVSAGQTPPFVDGQIAAIAATNELTLVTYNAADFRAFAGLTIMDWAY